MFVKITGFCLKAKCEFDTDMDTLIGRLEKVCRLLKEDEVAQRSLALVLYGKVALIKYETCSGEAISAYSCQACDILNLSLHKSGFYSVNLI